MLLATSCSDNGNNDVFTTTFTLPHYNRVVNNQSQEVTFSETTGEYVLDMTNYRLSLRLTAKHPNGNIAFSLNELQLNFNTEQQCYNFSAPDFSASGFSITDFGGKFDLATNNIYIKFVVDGKYTAHITRVLFMPRCETNIVKDSDSFLNKDAFYHFEIDPSTMAATMTIHGYRMAENQGSIGQVTFSGLKAEVTATGYHITAPMTTAQPAYASIALTNVDITIADNGQSIAGQYTSNGYEAIVSGKAFYKIN